MWLWLATILCAAAFGQNAAVRVSNGSLQLPTYIEGAPDPVPEFQLYATGIANYPYPVRRNFTQEKRTETWRTLNLENEYLLCRILPELGGHLYNCTDKRSGREIFYVNPVVKPSDVGRRGSWVAMGIESSFPVAHSRATTSPVDSAIQNDADGSGRAVVKDVDRATGMEWRVEYVLRPGNTVIEQRVMLYNPGITRKPYEWWSNAEVALDDPGLRFVVPTNMMSSHGATEIVAWPNASPGKDESLVAGHKDAYAWFAYGTREPFFAAFKPGTRSGVAHFADPGIVTGKKLWIWGSDQDAYVRKELTENNSSYVEIQAGLFRDQETFQFLEPEQFRGFNEYWIPVFDLGGVTRVTPDAIVNLQRRAKPATNLLIEVSATHTISGAVIRLLNGSTVVYEDRAELNPARVYSHVLDNPPGKFIFQLLDSRGTVLLQQTEGEYDADPADRVKLGKQTGVEGSSNGNSEAALLAKGDSEERNAHLNDARSDYMKGLELFPSSVAMQKAAGRLALELDRFEEAAGMLSRVHAAAPADDEVAYLLGVAEAMRGRDGEARQALLTVGPDSVFRLAAALQLTLMAGRGKDYGAASAALPPLLTSAESTSRVPPAIGAIEVALLRARGNTAQAKLRLAAWRASDPADILLGAESVLSGDAGTELGMQLAADAERVLHVADHYLTMGMPAEALRFLDLANQPPPKDHQIEPGAVSPMLSPLVAYYRGYCRKLLGQDAAGDFRDASKLPTRYVFPFRPSSFTVLSAALEANASDATARFLLGRLLLNRLMIDEAIAEWQKARVLHPALPDLYRDLGKALAELKKDPAGALAVVREGMKSTPEDADLRTLAEHVTASPAPIVALPASGATPLELAQNALLVAVGGKPGDGAKMFDPRVFTAEKQPNEVRRAYIEIQLLGLLLQSGSDACATVIRQLDRLGGEDPNLAFTVNGFSSFMNAPHFEYYSAMLEAGCGDEKSAKKHWVKLSKATVPLSSPEYVYALMALWRANPDEAKPKISAALAAVQTALGKERSSQLLFFEGMLLRASGQAPEAASRLQEVAKDSKDSWIQYLATLGLRESLQAIK